MAQNLIAALFALATLATTSPAVAQDDGPVSAESSNPALGFLIENLDPGFELVTHGVWRSPAAQLPSAGISSDAVSGTPRGASRQGSKRLHGAAPNFRRAAYLPHVYAAEAQYGLPTGLLDALIWTESRYNPFAISGAGAAGLGQLMPKTARGLGVANRFDPHANLLGAAQYLRLMLNKFGAVHLAVAAYNAGPGAVERTGGIPRNGETPTYVRRVLAFWRNQ